MNELMFEEMDTDVDREYEILENMDRYDMTYEDAEAFYEADHIDDEEMEAKVYNNCDLGELKELEGSYITKVEYNDATGVADITGIKSETGDSVKISFQISGGMCYVCTEKE